jgi:hypothetical protein
MAKDVIARLKADTEQWDKGMAEATKGMKNFQAQGQSMNNMVSMAGKQLAKFAGAWLTVEAGVKAFNKVIAGSQSYTDAWGRTMEATTAVTERFFDSIAQGNFSGFLSGLKEVISSAREAYDAMDALGTHLVFNDLQMAKFENRRKTYKSNIKQNIDVEANKEALRKLQKEEEAYLKTQSERYRDAANDMLGKHIGNAKMVEFIRPYLEMMEYGQDSAMARASNMRAEHSWTAREEVLTPDGARIWKNVPKWSSDTIRKQVEALEAYGQMHDDKLKEITSLFARAERADEAYKTKQIEDIETLNFKGSTGGGSSSLTAPKFLLDNISPLQWSTTTSMAKLQSDLAQAQNQRLLAGTSEAAAEAEKSIATIQAKIEAQPIALRLSIPEEEIMGVQSAIKDLSDKMRTDMKPLEVSSIPSKPLEDTKKQVVDIDKALAQTSQSFGMMGQAMSMLEDPSAKVAGIVMSAIAQVAQSFATALASEVKNPWTWMAAALSGAAVMTSTIASIKSATAGSYADGGLVKGNSYVGDAVPIMANVGEVILNASQQSNLASQLQPRDMGGSAQPFVSGEQIFLGLSNHLRRSGRGELITSKR